MGRDVPVCRCLRQVDNTDARSSSIHRSSTRQSHDLSTASPERPVCDGRSITISSMAERDCKPTKILISRPICNDPHRIRADRL